MEEVAAGHSDQLGGGLAEHAVVRDDGAAIASPIFVTHPVSGLKSQCWREGPIDHVGSPTGRHEQVHLASEEVQSRWWLRLA